MAKKAQLSLSEVRKHFGAWQVPSQEHFEALINIAALSLKAGPGLSGGDPSTEADRVDTEQVTPLTVKAHNGMEAAPEGLGVKPDPGGGLAIDNGALHVHRSDSVAFDDNGVFLNVNTSKALKVEREGIAVQVKPKAGLKEPATAGVSLHVDSNTLEVDENGALRLKCAPSGGLTAGQDGYLVVNLDIILRRS